jgi:outer membrane protein assembly factor BamA
VVFLPLMSERKALLFWILGCLSLSSSLFAQSYPVQKITFAGDPSFSSTELVAASGVAPGASIDQAAMQAGAVKLNDSGMFATVHFSFNGQELHYELTPATNLLPARFANFPWWQEKEIAAQLGAKVPLFHGEAAPESGTQQKLIEALTAMLAARDVKAQVEATQSIGAGTGKADALVFRVTNPAVQIGELTFTGATPEWSDRLAEIQKAASTVDYSASESPATLTQAIQHVYRDKGYLEVKVPSVVAQPPVLNAGVVRVPMAIAIEPGAQYRLGHFSLAGSVLMDQAQFLASATVKPGDVVEEDKLRQTMRMLSSPYVTRGYLRAKISAMPDYHREQGTVDYAITVTPGDVYTMGKLDVKDLDAEKTTLFLKIWKLNAGAPYDASYVAQFLKKNAKDLHPLDGYSAGYKQYEHEDTHVVDLVVSFVKGGLLN